MWIPRFTQLDGEFRVLFAEWVATLCKTIVLTAGDNPPGVNYDDQDPDDDIL
jgi:hypothetical protein